MIVSLIANTTMSTGLRVQAEVDTGSYATKIKVSDEELAAVHLQPEPFHGEWNCAILSGAANEEV